MKIGIIGSGNMGRAMGVRLSRLGHAVMFGARRIEQARAAMALADAAEAGTNEEAASFGDVLFWTMREADPTAVLADPGVLDGRIVIDLNNRDYATEARTGGWFGEAFAERLQAAAPKAHVVKAFNTIAVESFGIEADDLRAAGAQTFIAGADPAAKAVVADLALALGFEAVDMGAGAAAFRAVEALGDVIRLLMIDGGRGASAHLALLKLPEPSAEAIGARLASSYS